MEETQKDTTSPRVTRRGAVPRQNGPAIRALREKDGWTQSALAKAAGISQSALADIEREVDNASLIMLNRIARQLVVPVAAIVRLHRDSAAPAAAAEAA